jgi:hypothetical protein
MRSTKKITLNGEPCPSSVAWKAKGETGERLNTFLLAILNLNYYYASTAKILNNIFH